MRDTDLCIIGAGPAGMAAARTAADSGVSCVLLDEQPTAGGQIYRSVTNSSPIRRQVLGEDYYEAGLNLTGALDHTHIQYFGGATVWSVQADGTVGYSIQGRGHALRAQRLLIASGALERPVPIPGWTLPGVMTAGAAQVLLKSSGLLGQRAVIAGAGPLPYLLAQQLVGAGTPPLALVETQSRRDAVRAARHLPSALKGWRPLVKGLGMLKRLRRAGVQRYVGASDLKVLGDEQAEGLAFEANGQHREIECENVFLHQGVVPNIQITRALGCEHRWDDHQACFHPVLDAWGRSSQSWVFVAGDGGGIYGAEAAEQQGRLAALEIAHSLGVMSTEHRDSAAAPLRRVLAREQAPRRMLDVLYPPPQEVLTPADETIICRCEEITAAEIRRQADLGCRGPNQTKIMSRCGMGPCQGRYCGLTVTNLLAKETDRHPDEVGYYNIRPPFKPITLGELSDLNAVFEDA